MCQRVQRCPFCESDHRDGAPSCAEVYEDTLAAEVSRLQAREVQARALITAYLRMAEAAYGRSGSMAMKQQIWAIHAWLGGC